MAVMGINTSKNGFNFAILDGDKKNPILIDSGHMANHNASHDVQHLVNWYETAFQNLITSHKPESIGIKVSLDAKIDTISSWYYPIGFIHSIAYKNSIHTNEFTNGNFTPSKFSLIKETNMQSHIDIVFGSKKPKWDKRQKDAVLAAWMMLQ